MSPPGRPMGEYRRAQCTGSSSERAGPFLMGGAEAWAHQRGATLPALASRRGAAFHSAPGYEESATCFRKVLKAR